MSLSPSVRLGPYEIAIQVGLRMQKIFSTRLEAFLSRFKTEAVTQAIVDHGGDLYRHWHPSHGIDVNDAMLAATPFRR